MNMLLDDTVRFLNKMGIEPDVEHARHIKIRFTDRQKRKHLVVLSSTPSSPHALKRNRSLLRRLLKRQ